jgi:aminoglycoside 3'-phosphotransferase II
MESIRAGESGAAVWRCTGPAQPTWYLKTATVEAQPGLDREAATMRWMRTHELPVPDVIEYLRLGDTEYLLAGEAAGVPASEAEWREDTQRVAAALGRALARLHATDATACPFDRRISRQMTEARAHGRRPRARR